MTFTYLVLAFKPVYLPVNSIQAGRQQIARYPLISVVPSLCVHFGDTHWSWEIKLDPLVVIIVSCAPGSHVTAMLYSTQSSQPSRVMFVVLRRCGYLGITELSNQWITTNEDWNEDMGKWMNLFIISFARGVLFPLLKPSHIEKSLSHVNPTTERKILS